MRHMVASQEWLISQAHEQIAECTVRLVLTRRTVATKLDQWG